MQTNFSFWLRRSASVSKLPCIKLHIHWTFWPALILQENIFSLINFIIAVALHEAAHVIACSKIARNKPRRILFAFGGVPIDCLETVPSGRDRMRILLSGPLVSLCAGILTDAAHPSLRHLAAFNIVWGLIHLLPFWPLDGGMILRERLLGKGTSGAAVNATVLQISRIAGICLLVMSLLAANTFLVYVTLVCWAVCHMQFFPLMSLSNIAEMSWQWLKTTFNNIRSRIP